MEGGGKKSFSWPSLSFNAQAPPTKNKSRPKTYVRGPFSLRPSLSLDYFCWFWPVDLGGQGLVFSFSLISITKTVRPWNQRQVVVGRLLGGFPTIINWQKFCIKMRPGNKKIEAEEEVGQQPWGASVLPWRIQLKPTGWILSTQLIFVLIIDRFATVGRCERGENMRFFIFEVRN